MCENGNVLLEWMMGFINTFVMLILFGGMVGHNFAQQLILVKLKQNNSTNTQSRN